MAELASEPRQPARVHASARMRWLRPHIGLVEPHAIKGRVGLEVIFLVSVGCPTDTIFLPFPRNPDTNDC
jgi:hypothetical protein